MRTEVRKAALFYFCSVGVALFLVHIGTLINF